VSLSVGLSNFAGSIGIGLSGIDARTRLRVGVAFGLFEGMMPVIGLLIGQAVAGTIGNYGRYLGAVLLVLTGAYTIWQGRNTGKAEPAQEPGGAIDNRQLLVLGIALSLDNLIVGFALGVYHVSIVLAAVTMAVVSVGLSLLGLELGSRLGSRAGEYSEEAGGAVLILVGIAIGVGLI
jgi:manganese efflux pump family protein